MVSKEFMVGCLLGGILGVATCLFVPQAVLNGHPVSAPHRSRAPSSRKQGHAAKKTISKKVKTT